MTAEEMTMDEQRARELMPWLLNGTLAGEERQRLLAALGASEALRSELAETRRVGEIFAAHVGAGDLVAYAFGDATAVAGERITAHLAGCERCAEDLALVEESRAALDGESGAGGGRVLPLRRPVPEPAPRRRRWLEPLAAAAGLVAVLGLGGWSLSLHQQLEQSQQETQQARLAAARAQTEVAARPAAVEPPADLEVVRSALRQAEERQQQLDAELGRLESRLAERPATVSGDANPLILGTARGAGEAAATASGGESLVLMAPVYEQWPAYRLRVTDAAGAVVAQGPATLRPLPGGRYLVRVLPGPPPGVYTVTALGVSEAGEEKDLGNWEIQVRG